MKIVYRTCIKRVIDISWTRLLTLFWNVWLFQTLAMFKNVTAKKSQFFDHLNVSLRYSHVASFMNTFNYLSPAFCCTIIFRRDDRAASIKPSSFILHTDEKRRCCKFNAWITFRSRSSSEDTSSASAWLHGFHLVPGVQTWSKQPQFWNVLFAWCLRIKSRSMYCVGCITRF